MTPEQQVASSAELFDLPSLSFAHRSKMPSIRCVYFVIANQSELFYIGSTVNLKNRWRHHSLNYQHRAVLENSRIAWIEIPESTDVFIAEQLCIYRLRPTYNPICTAACEGYVLSGQNLIKSALSHYLCCRCGYGSEDNKPWISRLRGREPVSCPQCKSRNWNRAV